MRYSIFSFCCMITYDLAFLWYLKWQCLGNLRNFWGNLKLCLLWTQGTSSLTFHHSICCSDPLLLISFWRILLSYNTYHIMVRLLCLNIIPSANRFFQFSRFKADIYVGGPLQQIPPSLLFCLVDRFSVTQLINSGPLLVKAACW